MTEREPNERYKVGRVLAEYGLTDLHEALPARWLGEDGEAESLRTLAERINVAVLEAAMVDAGMDPLDGEVENAHRLLTDDDVTAGVRTEQRNHLERAGVDVDAVREDFVTHQAVYTYLTDALDVSKERGSDAVTPEAATERIERLRSRTTAVTADALDGLASRDAVTVGEYDVVVDVQVYCRDCQSQRAVASLLDAGGCDCAQ